MIKLYWSPRSRSFSAIWLLEESGLPYERVLTDISTAPSAAGRMMPHGASTPAASGIARML